MLPPELWIHIANYMQNKELYHLSLCSKDIYSSTRSILNIRRLIVKFVNRCALSYLTYRPFYDPEQYHRPWLNILPSLVCISEYQMLSKSNYITNYPWFINRYVKQYWELYFIPWQLGSSHERMLYLESHPGHSFINYHSTLRGIKMNIENMKKGIPINKSYTYFHKAEPGITEKEGYIKQYRHPDYTVCCQCNLIGKHLDVDEANHVIKLGGNSVRRYVAYPICTDCLEASYERTEEIHDWF